MNLQQGAHTQTQNQYFIGKHMSHTFTCIHMLFELPENIHSRSKQDSNLPAGMFFFLCGQKYLSRPGGLKHKYSRRWIGLMFMHARVSSHTHIHIQNDSLDKVSTADIPCYISEQNIPSKIFLTSILFYTSRSSIQLVTMNFFFSPLGLTVLLSFVFSSLQNTEEMWI
jgi:hypothetical protein